MRMARVLEDEKLPFCYDVFGQLVGRVRVERGAVAATCSVPHQCPGKAFCCERSAY